MGCTFCATGQAGFERHLSVGEIVEQVMRAARRARDDGRRLSNVVFMGMGEPLANYDATWAAVERLHDALGLWARQLTVSTVGIVPGIRRLASEALPVNLAVSLHAANDALRDELVPINRRYPLTMLMDACAGYLAAKGRRLSFEWAMIDGVNDRPQDAAGLAELSRSLPIPAHVNLIPLNPTPGYAVRGSPPRRVREFRDLLRAAASTPRFAAPEAPRSTPRAASSAPTTPSRSAHQHGRPLAEPDGPREGLRRLDHASRHTTQRSSMPSTTAPGSTTLRPPLAARLAARYCAGVPQSTKGPS